MATANDSPGPPYLLRANGVPLTPDGRVLHLELGAGDVANNIITVGSESRCAILHSLLDKKDDKPTTTPTHADNDGSKNSRKPSRATVKPLSRRSKRGFITHTGTFNGIDVSIIMINMGYPNMDFLVREVRAVTEGPLRIIRLGSCAGLRSDLPVGTVAVASQGSILIRQNPTYWGSQAIRDGAPDALVCTDTHTETSHTRSEPYAFYGVAPADDKLSRGLMKELKAAFESEKTNEKGEAGVVPARVPAVVGCLNASTDSFYSSQGRLDRSFADCNDDIIPRLLERHPSAGSFEMETFQLFHLARICRKSTVHASAASIVLANRIADNAIAQDRIAEIELRAGEAVLRAITAPLDSMDENGF